MIAEGRQRKTCLAKPGRLRETPATTLATGEQARRTSTKELTAPQRIHHHPTHPQQWPPVSQEAQWVLLTANLHHARAIACTDPLPGAVRARPTLPLRSAAPAITFSTCSARQQNAQVPQKEPKEAAKSVLDSLPGDSIASKIGILSAGTGLSVAAISNELYVVNEESIVFFSLLTIYFGVYNYVGPMYKEFADNYSNKIKNILNAARDDHTNAVKSRISSVSDLGGVIQTTKDLFAVSKARHSGNMDL